MIVTLFPDRAERYFEAPQMTEAEGVAAVSAACVTAPHPALTAEALAEIYAHARREHPNECCGIVFGPQAASRSRRARSRA